jgi:hypothetical protein
MLYLTRTHLVAILTGTLGLSSVHAELDAVLTQKLEGVYSQYRQSLTQQDTAGWLKQTSRYRQMCLRNQVISAGLTWPKAILDLALKPPSVSGLKMLDVTARGNTARLTYFGKIDFGIPGEAAPDNGLVVWFLKEGEEWKYNTTQYANLSNDPALKAKVAKGETEFLNSSEFAVTGEYPAVPKACETPYHVARVQVTANGYKTIVTVNGVNPENFATGVSSRTVIGGIRKGPNKILIAGALLKGVTADKASLEIDILTPTGNPAQPERSLLNWKYDPAKGTLPAEVTLWGASKVSIGQ